MCHMKLYKQLPVFSLVLATLAVPLFGAFHSGTMVPIDASQMPAPGGECAIYCGGNNNLPHGQPGNLQNKKELERAPSPPPLDYRHLIQPISLTAFYTLLPIIFLQVYYKDPKLILSTQLRF